MQTPHLISIQLDLDPERRVEILGRFDQVLRDTCKSGWTGKDVDVAMYAVEPRGGWTGLLGWL